MDPSTCDSRDLRKGDVTRAEGLFRGLYGKAPDQGRFLFNILLKDRKDKRVARTLLVTKGIATRNKDATSGSWRYY